MKFPAFSTVLGGIGISVTSIALWVGSGLFGLLAAGVLFVLWYLVPAPYAVTFGQVALATVVLSVGTPVVVAVGEAGLILALLGPISAFGISQFLYVSISACVVVLTFGAWGLYFWLESLRIPTVVLVGTLSLASYGLYRYETAVGNVVEGDLDA